MKFTRLLTSLIFGLGLTLALGLPLFAGREARAVPLRADVWRNLPVTDQPIENQPSSIENFPERLSEDAWGKIRAQLRRDSYELAPASDAASGYQAANRAHDLRVGFGIDSLIIFQATKLTVSDAADNDRFGGSVSISGDTVVVGKSGAAYIFERNQGGADSWGQVTKLTTSNDPNDDWFGCPVFISGDTVVVGASGDDGTGLDRGAVYVFERNQGGADSWGQVKKLTSSDAEDLDNFGSSVFISGNTVVVGAPREGGAGTARGAAYIYESDQGGPDNWGQVKKLTASDAADYAEFGWGVSTSGDTVVVGSPFEGDRRGAAYIYGRDQGGADSWGQVKKLTASDAEDWDFFGGFSAISGDTLIVAAHGEDGEGSGRGAAYVFERNQGGADGWGQVKKLTASDAADNDWFGDSVSISGDTTVVGADHKNSYRGAAYVYERNQGGANSWGQVKKLTTSDAADWDFFGVSASISGDTLVVGAAGENGAGSNRGAAYVFGLKQGNNIYLPLVVRNK